MVKQAEDRQTRAARRRSDRIAPVYDLLEGLWERRTIGPWRSLLWSRVEGGKILEVGAGTGNNFPCYPPGGAVTAIDFSEKMLRRAREKAARGNNDIDLRLMDVQALEFEDSTFDCVVGTFVFCSVPDPVRGLRECARVCKPGGQVLLMEHVLGEGTIKSLVMNLLNPLASRITCDINRCTMDDVAAAGMTVERVTDLSAGIFKLIEARKPQP